MRGSRAKKIRKIAKEKWVAMGSNPHQYMKVKGSNTAFNSTHSFKGIYKDLKKIVKDIK